jgi:transposase IS116/IS110/IS902 family protein
MRSRPSRTGWLGVSSRRLRSAVRVQDTPSRRSVTPRARPEPAAEHAHPHASDPQIPTRHAELQPRSIIDRLRSAYTTTMYRSSRKCHTQRLRHALREYFPAALVAFEDLDAADALELLAKAPEAATAARLTITQISAALTRARRRHVAEKAERIQAVLRGEHLGQPEVLTAAYAATTRAAVGVLRTLDEQVKVLQGQVDAHFGRHPDAEIISSQPGLGPVLGARVLAEFGDDPHRYTDAKARKNYAGTSPITRASGKKKVVLARFVHNDWLIDALIDALMSQAFSALNASPGARAYYDQPKARGTEHNAALRQLAHRLVGILHGCLKTRTCYDEATAWSQRVEQAAA